MGKDQQALVKDVLGDALPPTIYWDAFLRFGYFAVLLLVGVTALVLLINEVSRRGAPPDVVFVLWVLVALLVGVLVVAFFAWQKQNEQYDNRESVRFQLQNSMTYAAIQVNNVDVRGRGNTVLFGQQQNVTDPTPDVGMTQTYAVALRIAEKAIEGWNMNGGKRPKIKPFSAKAINEEMNVGGECWTAAIGIVEGAGIGRNLTEGQWEPLIQNPARIPDMLLTHLNRQGWVSYKQNGQQYWHKAGASPTLLGGS